MWRVILYEFGILKVVIELFKDKVIVCIVRILNQGSKLEIFILLFDSVLVKLGF